MTDLDSAIPTSTATSAANATAHNAAKVELLTKLRQADYSFTTVTPTTHAFNNARTENQQARDLRDIFGWNRPFTEAVAGSEWLALMQRADVIEPWRGLWRSRIRVSTLGDQLYMHSAFPTTRTDAVFFGPDTYRFVGAVQHFLSISKTPIHRVVDVGCGAGPGAIAVAAALPHAEVYAVDINQTALQMTQINADAAGVLNIIPRFSDLLSNITGTFDLIIANPPYLIDPNARTYRHGGGEQGEGLSLEILAAALPLLAADGSLVLYTGVAISDGIDAFRAAAQAHIDEREFAWSYSELDPDIFAEELAHRHYSKAERIAAVLLQVTRCRD